MEKNDFRFDKRVVRRNLRKGNVSRDEYERYLGNLKDLSQDATMFEASLIPVKKKIPTRVLNEDDEL